MRRLSTVLQDRPHTRPLRDRRVRSDRIELAFVDHDPISSAFAAMVRDQAFDVCEIAIGAFLQARAEGAPLTLLPVVVFGGFHHASLRRLPGDGALTPAGLAGETLAVRSYSQTTGLWVRALLAEQYGVDLTTLRWRVTEGSHSAGYHDPPNVIRAPEGQTLREMLDAGEAAALVTAPSAAVGTEPVIADLTAAEDAWYAAQRVVPINHLVCVRDEIARDAEVVTELYQMLCVSHELVLGPSSQRELRPGIPSPVREGIVAVAPGIELAASYALAQGLIRDPPQLDRCFPDAL
jgi:4,5-dihydroxyphthalate decarboxylase